MPYQRITTGPTWNAIAPGELMTRGSTERRISRGYEETGTPDARLLALLGSEKLVQRRHVDASSERDRDPVGSAWPESDQAARPDEDLQDDRRVVRECIRRIVAPAHDATVSAAIGFDAALEKLRGMLLHDAALPGFEDDRALVLSSAPCCGNSEGQALAYALTILTAVAAQPPRDGLDAAPRSCARHTIDHLRLPFV